MEYAYKTTHNIFAAGQAEEISQSDANGGRYLSYDLGVLVRQSVPDGADVCVYDLAAIILGDYPAPDYQGVKTLTGNQRKPFLAC